MNIIFISLLLFGRWNLTPAFSQRYVDIQVGKVLSSPLLAVKANTLQECAGHCISKAPTDTCNVAAFNRGSNICQLGSTSISQVFDVADGDSLVMFFFKMCGQPPKVLHGTVVISADRSTATFSCEAHYALNGSTTVTCIEDMWEGAPPTCVDVDECSSSPCINGGTCIDNVGNYTCSCVKGYTGINCERDIDECASQPCINIGICLDDVNGYTCLCPLGYTGVSCETVCTASYPSDCKAYKDSGNTTDGVYTVQLGSCGATISVYCDMTTTGGGWTVMQNRFDGSVDFYRGLVDYENGFGTLTGEFWLGLKYVQEMLNQGSSELRLHVTRNDSTTFSRVFQDFSIGSDNQYIINFADGVGSAVTLTRALEYHRGRCFSTLDRDCQGTDCPVKTHSGWWFNSCFEVNLNGLYMTPGVVATVPGQGYYGGITHYGFVGSYEALKTSRLMFRRI